MNDPKRSMRFVSRAGKWRWLRGAGLALVLAWASTAHAQEPAPESTRGEIPQFGGPSSVGGQLAEDQEGRELLSWRERLQEAGFSFGLNFSALYQGASDSPGEDEAAGGIFQLPVSWTLQEGESSTGTLVFKSEWRGRLGTDIPPQDLGFAAGAVSITGTQFSDIQWAVTNLYWQQRFNDGRISFNIGRVDATDYLDVYGLINPQTSFQNLAFSTSPSIASPNQGLGLALGAMLGERFYVLGGFADANADPTRTGIDTFDFGEMFKHIEFGWTPSQDRVWLDNAHITFWHVDERAEAGVPSGSGGTLSWARLFDGRSMPVVRVGFSDGGGAALQEGAVATGLGWFRPKSRDLAGLGVAWADPSEDFGDVPEQWTVEAFYRWMMAPVLALTADLQWIVDPALNPDEDQLFVFGLRLRLAL